MTTSNLYQLIVPAGTQVVARGVSSTAEGNERPAGAVGVVVASPVDAQHAYRVRFADGAEVSLRRTEFSILKHFQRAQPEAVLETDDHFSVLRPYVIYRCVVGSRAYGLDHEDSDVDLRGIYLPSAEMQWSLYGVPEQIEQAETDEVYWELQKFLALALKANPTVLECLYTPQIIEASELATELRGMREIFLSRLIYQSYGGYVFSQFRKLEQDLRVTGVIRWKHAMHLIRLLLSGITALREGFVPVEVAEHRDALLAIRYERTPWEEVNAWRLALHREFDQAFAATQLPERPDYERVNAFLIRARRRRV